MRTPDYESNIAIAAGLTAGTIIGFLDVGAREVQGPLLLLMVAAFLITMLTDAAPVVVGIAVFIGLPVAHLVSRLLFSEGDPQFAIVIAVVPIMVASFGGKGVSVFVQRASSDILGAEPR